MGTVGRGLLIAILNASLIAAPLLAAPPASVGIVIQAQGAQIGSDAVIGGATVYPGDTLSTSPDGSVRLRSGTGQVYLLSSSAASFTGSASGVSAMILRGTAGFSTAGGQAFELRTADAVIRPKSSQPTHGRVTVVSPTRLIVASLHGPLELRVGDETYTIADNTAYRVDLESEAIPATPDDDHHRARKTHALLVLLGVAAVSGVVGYLIYRAFESPSRF